MIARRKFLGGLAGILAAGAAPAIIHDAMKIHVPKRDLLLAQGWSWIVNFEGSRPLHFPAAAGRGQASSLIHVDESPILEDKAYQKLQDTFRSDADKYGMPMARFIREWENHNKLRALA